MQVEIKAPYLLFLGDEPNATHAKTAIGIAHWRPEFCVAQIRLPGCGADLGVPDMTPAEAAAAGARSMIWGVAGVGGLIPPHWIDTLFAAVGAGLNIVAGTHASLSQIPGLADAAAKAGVSLTDIRQPPADLPVGTGQKRCGFRLLTVGTDCVVGKKFTALSIAREMLDRGIKSDFRATGQTGIMIAGGGIPIDAVVSDFVSGAAEVLSPDNDIDHWDIIEGQGSLFHPGYAAVTLGLMHGSQPDAFVVCHEAGRTMIEAFPDFMLPSIPELIERTVAAGRLTNSAIRCVGISINTSGLSNDDRAACLASAAAESGLPCVDPVATGVGPLVDYIVETFR
jgi:D-glutamate N-acetyltransferase